MNKPTPPRTPRRSRMNMLTMAQTLRIVLSGRFTRQEIVDATGIHDVTAMRWVNTMRKLRLIHVADWLPDTLGRDGIAVFELGDAPDKKRRALSGRERARRHRENLKLKKEKA